MSITPANQDEEHLRLLTIFHYVVGGMTILFGCFPLIHLGIGIYLIASPETMSGHGEPPPPFLGWLFAGIGAFLFLMFQTIGICTVVAGRRLARRRSYMFVFVAACVQCLMFPFGTALGICTILVLSRPTVKALFGHPVAPPPAISA